VTVAIAASSVAQSSARLETMFMDLGAAAGVAARLVVDDGGSKLLPVQDVSVSTVQNVLQTQFGQRVKGPYWS